MGASFPIPVLAVAADAIRDLEGRDALSGLWTLFTKCKESLQDGRRLENISWRLWYREIMLTNLERERELDGEKFGSPTLEKANDHALKPSDSVIQKTFYPLQTSPDPSTLPPPYSPFNSENAPSPQTTPNEPSGPLGSSPGLSSSPAPLASLSRTSSPNLSPSISSHNRRPSTSSRRSSFLNGTNGTPLSVGKIIFDMLPSSTSTNSGDSNKAPVTALFIPRPALSHKSTSSTIVSGEDIDNKPDVDLKLTPSASSKLDPKIQMTPIEPSLSPTPPAPLNVLDDVRSTKLSLPDFSTVSMLGNRVSYLPTPEPQDSEPSHSIVVVGNSPSVTPHAPGISSSIPPWSIPSNMTPNNLDGAVSLSIDPDEKSKRDLEPDPSLAIRQSIYTGPPSPSLSDSYACAHPGEVCIKEVGLLPSLSISRDMSGPASSQPRVEVDYGRSEPLTENHQTPPSSSSTTLVQMQNLLQPPTLVVVNPTPGPTPHPTPPATPVINGSIGPGGLIKSQWLALPEGAAGARQHHLLQAAQQQLGLQLGTDMNTSRLPPAFVGNGNDGSENVTITATSATTSGSINRGLDRSRSDTMAAVASPQGLTENGTLVVSLEHSSTASDPRISISGKSQKPVRSSSVSPFEQNGELQQSKDSASDRSSLSGHAESSTTNTTVSEYDNLDNLDNLDGTPSSKLKSNEEQQAAMFEVHSGGIGMALHGPKRLSSLSTIQSMATLTDRKKDINGLRNSDSDVDGRGGVGANLGSDGIIMERDEEEEVSSMALSGDSNQSPRNDKRRKRSSAPAPLTSSYTLFASPTGSGSTHPHQVSSPKSATSTTSGVHVPHNTKRKQITVGGRSSSRSGSTGGGSSLGKSKSRSRSREAGGVVGLGGLGMTQAVPPAPPSPGPVVTRKAPMVAGGRGRSKVVLGRTGAKAKGAIRRNSSGNTAARGDNGKADAELERERIEREVERVEKDYQERMKVEALGKARERSLPEEEAEWEEKQRVVGEGDLALAAIREREAEEAEEEMARRRAGQQQQAIVGVVHVPNSQEGVGLGSKGTSSSSGHSPGRSKGKGKGKQRDEGQQEDDKRQQHYQHQYEQQHQHQQQQPQLPLQEPATEHPNKEPRQFLQQISKKMSKPQLRQLQMLEKQLNLHQTQMQVDQLPTALQHDVQTRQQEREGVKAGGERPGGSRKGKEREVEPVVSERRPSKSNGTKTHTLLDPNLEQHLGAPLLPQNRRKIVLATSESDFETDSDDGSWSSEEMTGDEEDLLAQEEQLRQEQLHQQRLLEQQLQHQQLQQKLLQQQQIQQQRQRQQQQQQQQLQQRQQQPARPQGVQRTQSSHYPAPNNARHGKQSSRAQQRHQHQVNAQAILDAAAEAQRQREMFVKLPTSSFQNLANARAKSVGLLTQLMNPNPEIFPPNHPYRRGFSSAEIKSGNVAPMRPLTALPPSAKTNKDQHVHPTIPEESAEKRDQQDKNSAASPLRRMHFSPPVRPGGLTRTKSAAAVPVSLQVAVGSMGSKVLPVIDHTSAAPSNVVTTSSAGKIRLGPPPADAEMEDDSDDESDSGGFSKSVAHEKLIAFARARMGGSAGRRRSNPVVAGLPTQAGPSAQPAPPPNPVAPPPPQPTQPPNPVAPQVQPAQPPNPVVAPLVQPAPPRHPNPPPTQPVQPTHPAPGPSTQPAQRRNPVVGPSAQPARRTSPIAGPSAQPAQANGDDNAVPNWVVSQPQAPQQQRPQQQQHTRTRSNPQQRSTVQFADIPETSRHPPPPAPIPVGYPYNLPISAVPSTPRTTRRQMLSTELPESLRRNLLWERQVSNGNLPAMRRSASGGGSRHSLLGGLQPLTVFTPMVQLRPRGTAPPENSPNERQQAPDPAAIHAEKKRRAMARNKSWANEYHTAGW